MHKKRRENAVSRILSFARGKESLPRCKRRLFIWEDVSLRSSCSLPEQRGSRALEKLWRTFTRGRRKRASNAPTPLPKLQRSLFLFGFAPCGACRAIHVAMNAVSSYLAVSPLPARGIAPTSDVFPRDGGLFSVALSIGSPPRTDMPERGFPRVPV